MTPPDVFTWVDKPLVAACAFPDSPENLAWLRQQGLDVLLTLTEHPVRRDWVDDAGIMSVHVPIPDMDAPTQEQIDQCLSVINKANRSNMGVAIHCFAGKGRTGTILASYFVHQGMTADAAIRHIRNLRPGSIEVQRQEKAIGEYERRLSAKRNPTK